MSGARGVGDVLRGGQDGSAQAQLSQGATWVAFSPSDVNVPGRALAHAQLGVLTGSAPSVRGSSHFCPVRLFGTTPWCVAHQTPLSMGFSRQAHWSGLPFPPPGDLPNPGIKPMSLTSPALADGFFTTSVTWEAHRVVIFTDTECRLEVTKS